MRLRFCVAFIAAATLSTSLCRAEAALSSVDELAKSLDAIRDALPACHRQLNDLKSRGQDVSYPLMTCTVLDRMTPPMREDLKTCVPNGWGFMNNNGAKASFEVVHDAHSGAWAAKISTDQPQTPNVYGMLVQANGVSFEKGHQYTLSAWVKSDDPGAASIPLNGSWTRRLMIPNTHGRWQQASVTFTPEDAALTPRILAEGGGKGFIIDDIYLVEGNKAQVGKNLMPNGGFEQSWSQQRIGREIPDMMKMLAQLQRELADAEAGKMTFPAVPKWTGKARPVIDGPSFIADAQANGKPVGKRPIFFVGYGHFGQVRKDVDIFPDYGINIVQHAEFGPASVFPEEGKTDDAAIDRLNDELTRAAKAGVAVDFLLSPHYVPDWFFKKYPQTRKPRADFFPYSVYASQPLDLIKKFIDYVLPKIRNQPALLSVCLSNEPINREEPDANSIKAWHAWLMQRDGNIAKLNERWNTHYASFDEVPQPNPLGQSAEPRPGPAWAEFIRWNEDYFADWHKALADEVHRVAPGIPVHIKDTTWQMYRSENIYSGDEPTLFGRFTDINGNDSANLWGFNGRSGDMIERGGRDFAQGWRENAIGNELQRSVHNAPVFDSENHLIFDRETRYVDPAHIRAALWMGAIHGQSATTIWVWEYEKSNPQSDVAGSIMERPSCAQAVGIVCDDLNRAAPAVTAIQKSPARLLILQNNDSAAWDGHRYDDCFLKTFTALSYTGLKAGFLTERQLEAGQVVDAPILFVPDSIHLSNAAFAGLQSFKGKIVIIGGDDVLSKDEYGRPRTARLPKDRMLESIPFTADKTSWQALWNALPARLKEAGTSAAIDVVSADDRPQSAVQWQTASDDRGLIVNLYNASNDPQTVKIVTPDQKPAGAMDLLTNESIDAGKTLTLAPLEVRLLRVTP